MGLAAYGQPNRSRFPIILEDDGYRIDLLCRASRTPLEITHLLQPAWTNWLAERFGPAVSSALHWSPSNGRATTRSELPTWAADLAASVQRDLVEAVVHLAELAVRRAGSRRLVLAGGVALNCAANGEILARGCVEELYVPPVTNDAGGALGAAQWIAAQIGSVERLQSAALGPAFQSKEIVAALERSGIPFYRSDDLVSEISSELVAGRTVGWFQGRMEIGPRALGHRSMLALPHEVTMNSRMNTIKGREAWRPLAPSILAEQVGSIIPGFQSSPYMLLAGKMSEQGRALMPAVAHRDDTTRPQTVDDSTATPFRYLLESVFKKTGIPGLLNTSFNAAGEPIVCSPHDGPAQFFRTLRRCCPANWSSSI